MSEYRLPTDDETTIYVQLDAPFTLNDLLARAQEKWGEDIDFDAIEVTAEDIRVCHYTTYWRYEYDPDDFENFIVLRKTR